MDRTSFLFKNACQVYGELKENNALHLLDALRDDGYISPMQYEAIRELEVTLDVNNNTMATAGVSYKNNH